MDAAFGPFAISHSGLRAQRIRMDTIANNIANINTTTSVMNAKVLRIIAVTEKAFGMTLIVRKSAGKKMSKQKKNTTSKPIILRIILKRNRLLACSRNFAQGTLTSALFSATQCKNINFPRELSQVSKITSPISKRIPNVMSVNQPGLSISHPQAVWGKSRTPLKSE